VRVSFPVPRGIRKSDVTLTIADNSLRLTLRDFPQPLLDVLVPLPPLQILANYSTIRDIISLFFSFIHSSLFSLIVSTIDSFWRRICVSIDCVGSLHFEAKQLVTASLFLSLSSHVQGPLWGRVNAQKARQRGHKLTKSGRVRATIAPCLMTALTHFALHYDRTANGKRSTLYCGASAGGGHA
jgi:hypothetical protein